MIVRWKTQKSFETLENKTGTYSMCTFVYVKVCFTKSYTDAIMG